MIRFIILLLFLTVFFALSLIMLPVEWLVGKFNQNAKDRSSLAIVKFAFRVVLSISGVTTTVKGIENIPTDEPVLFIGNHNGFYDIIISYVLMKRTTGFVAKKEMWKVPILRRWMQNLYCLFLDRENMKEGLKTILKGIDYIKEGKSIVIFPEGTRNKGEQDLLPFKAGSFKFAEKTGCKIIPMTQNNTECIFENQAPRLKKTHTIIEFGTPIDINSLSKEDRKNIADYTRNIILETYTRNKQLL